MNRSDAETLWEVANLLARTAAKVSRRDGRANINMPPLLFLTDPERTPRPWETAARLPAGAGVIFRHFGAVNARDTALRLRDATRRRDGLLLIGLDAELAETVGADGVHLPERALHLSAALAVARPDWRITGAVHAPQALVSAHGLDAVLLSPVFPTTGPSSTSPALGLAVFRAMAATAPCPVYALGGINAACARSLSGSGACGLAGVSAIQTAFGPATTPG